MPILGIIASSFRSAAEPTGAYDSLATTTLSSNASSVTFAGIPSGYKHLQIRAIIRMTRAVAYASQCPMTFNGNTTNYYRGHYINGDGSTVASGAFTGSDSAWGIWAVGNSATANVFSSNIVDILDYQSTNKYKTVRVLYGTELNGVNSDTGLYSSLFMDTSAISSLTITCSNSSNFMQYSQFALYGVK